mgnify:CR=1 FL=1
MNLLTQSGLLMACGLLAGSVSFAAWTIMQVIACPKEELNRGNAFERDRLQKLRNGSSVFRWFEPLVRELEGFYDPLAERNRQLIRHLKLSGEKIPWKPTEFLSVKNIEAVLSGAAVFLLVAPTGFYLFAACLGFLLLVSYTWMAEQSVIKQSQRRSKTIRLRLPFVIDQIALMMQAGAEFESTLETVVADNVDHPLTVELQEVLRQISLGRPRAQALTEFRNRMDDKDVSELVFAINKGEELGTPLSSILREQADQIRLKRSQWAEQAASEAEVQMVFPGMIVMIACLLVIIAPIVLPALMTFLE